MKFKIATAALVTMLGATAILPEAAQARHHYRRHYTYYRHDCSGGNGAVGTIAGGVGGALIGNALGGGTIGTIAGGVGGGLLGRHLDKQHTRRRAGC